MEKKQALIRGKLLSYYENRKNKETENVLLFLHGWMQDGKSFKDIFKVLEEKNIPYISLDFPGFGSSELQSKNMTIEDYGNTVIDFIEKIGLKQPHLVGHSFGGRISIFLSSFYKNISTITLIGAAGIAYKIPLHKIILIKSAKYFFALPGLRSIGKKLKAGFSSPDARNAGIMTEIFKNTISFDLQEHMKSNLYRTLMIWGNNDDQVPVTEGKIMHNHMKNSEFYVLDGSHFIHQEQTQRVADMILNFTKKIVYDIS